MARYPVDKRIVLPSYIPFGGTDPNAKYGRHSGDDSANPSGTPVFAPASGTVGPYVGGTNTAQGITVEIFDGKYYPHIFHLRERLVSPGQEVTEGQLIAYSDNTGLSTGPHIHFGVSKVSVGQTKSFSDFIDPLEYIKQGGDTVKPTEAQVYDSFRRFALKEPASPEQVQSYMAQDIRVLYSDLLNYEVIPKVAEVEQAFSQFSDKPINTPPNTDQSVYYSNRSAKQLYLDLATDLKRRLDATPDVDPDVIINGSKYIKEV